MNINKLIIHQTNHIFHRLEKSNTPLPEVLINELSENIDSLQKITNITDYSFDELSNFIEILEMIKLRISAEQLKNSSDEFLKKIDNCLKHVFDVFIQKEIADEEDLDSLDFLDVAVFLDVDSPDHNGAILMSLLNALKDEVPIITTRSLVNGSGIEISNTLRDSRIALVSEYLKANEEHWDIYEQDNNEYIILLPISHYSELSGLEKLNYFDFVTNGDIRKISCTDLLSGPKSCTSIDNLFRLFKKSPSISKNFLVSGHGSTGSCTSLDSQNYRKFLHFLERQRTTSLFVISCHSGGPMSLEHVRPEAPLKFPVVIKSIGNFSTTISDEIKIGDFFQEFRNEVIIDSPHTYSRARSVLQSTSQSKEFTNLSQIMFPRPKSVPSGFRPVSEYQSVQNIDRVALLQKKLDRTPSDEISVNKNVAALHTLHIPITLNLHSANIKMLSMIPGNSHHLINKLKFEGCCPASFFGAMNGLYGTDGFNSRNAFFFGAIEPDDIDDEIMLGLCYEYSRKRISFLHREGSNYYFNCDGDLDEISPLEYACEVYGTYLRTRASEKALTATTGGHDTEKSLKKHLLEEVFWNDKFPLPQALECYIHLQENGQLNLLPIDTLTIDEKQQLLQVAIQDGETEFVENLLMYGDLDVNKVSRRGSPLICLACRYADDKVVSSLIRHGANVNVSDPDLSNFSPIHMAVLRENEPLIQALLDTEGVDLNATDEMGWNVIAYGVDNEQIFYNLLSQNAPPNINVVSNSGKTLLSIEISSNNQEGAHRLLNAGCDVNAGDKLPLIEAIYLRSFDMVQLLIDNGADVSKADAEGLTPLEAAKIYGTREILGLIDEKLK